MPSELERPGPMKDKPGDLNQLIRMLEVLRDNTDTEYVCASWEVNVSTPYTMFRTAEMYSEVDVRLRFTPHI